MVAVDPLPNDWEEAKEVLMSHLYRWLAQYFGASEKEVKNIFSVSEVTYAVFF